MGLGVMLRLLLGGLGDQGLGVENSLSVRARLHILTRLASTLVGAY